MKHADSAALDQLEDLLYALRALSDMREKQRGVFYLRSRAFLHFHSDPAGLFADLRVGAGFVRYAINTQEEREELLAAMRQTLT